MHALRIACIPQHPDMIKSSQLTSPASPSPLSLHFLTHVVKGHAIIMTHVRGEPRDDSDEAILYTVPIHVCAYEQYEYECSKLHRMEELKCIARHKWHGYYSLYTDLCGPALRALHP